MTIGKIKLGYIGKNDLILSGNPQISFWKYAYKRYSNFSMQSIELENDGYMNLKQDRDTVYKFKIPRNADLINNIHLKINLPDIYSKRDNNGEFRWIDNIGSSIIKTARLYFDNNLIEEITGEFIYIYHKLYTTYDELQNFNKLTGNIKELHTPYFSNNYKQYTDTIGNTENISGQNIFYLNKNYNNAPSISRYILNIPLIFCFFRSKQHIPLISCRSNEIFVEITLRPIRDLYTISKSNLVELYKPSYSFENIINNVVETQSTNRERIFYQKRFKDFNNYFFNFTKNIDNSYFNPRLEVNYVFLDNDERNLISTKNYHQLLPLLDIVSFKDIVEKAKLDINLYHPIQSVIIVPKKNNIDKFNKWTNFTNLDFKNQNIRMLQGPLLDLIKSESNYNNSDESDMFKYMGSFIKKDNVNSIGIISNPILKINTGDIGNIESVEVLNSGDSFIDLPKIRIITQNGSCANIIPTLKLKHAIILKRGTGYISNPKLVINNLVGQNASIETSVKNGEINSCGVINEGSGFIDNLDIKILDTFDFYDIKINNNGQQYLSEPDIFIENKPKNGYTNQDLINLNITNAEFRPVINNGKLIAFENTKLGTNYNLNIIDTNIYIGGQLVDIETDDSLLSTPFLGYSTFGNIPSFYIYDYSNPIISPEISLSYLDPTSNRSILKIDITSSGHGLSKNTTVHVGKVVRSVDLLDGGCKIGDIQSIRLVPKYYPYYTIIPYLLENGINSSKLLNSTDPVFTIVKDKNLNGIDAEFKIKLSDKFTIANGSEILYPTINPSLSINSNLDNGQLKLSFTLNNSDNILNDYPIEYLHSLALFINFSDYLGAFDKNLKPKKNLQIPIMKSKLEVDVNNSVTNSTIKLPDYFNGISSINLKLIKNFKSDITNSFNFIEKLNIKTRDNNSLGFSNHNVIAISFNNIEGLHNYESDLSVLNENDIVSLIIEDKFIDAVVIKKKGDRFYGVGISYIYYNDDADRLYFGSFTQNIFSLEVGRKIDSFEKIKGGYGYIQTPNLKISTITGGNLILQSSIVGSGGTTGRNIQLEPVIDFGGKNGKIEIEFDYGGTNSNLDKVVQIILDDYKISYVDFNWINIQNNNVYYNLLNTYGSDSIWNNFRDLPYYIVKGYPNNSNFEYSDGILKGVLDYGGSGCIANVSIDNGGSGGKINLDTSASFSNNNLLYELNVKSTGFNYKNSLNNSSGELIPDLTCSLVTYEINNIPNTTNYKDIIKTSAKILEQFHLIVENGMIKFRDGNILKILWRGADKYYNNIKIIDDSGINFEDDINKIYNVYNPLHSSESKYAIIVGGIPSENLNIISGGLNYGSSIRENEYWIPIFENGIIQNNSKKITVTTDLTNYISINDTILIENHKFTVNGISSTEIDLNQTYIGDSINNAVISYKDTFTIIDNNISVTNGSPIIVSSQDLSKIIEVNKNIKINNVLYTISVINSKNITLTSNYSGITQNNLNLFYELDFKKNFESIDKNPNLFVSILPNYNSQINIFKNDSSYTINNLPVSSSIVNGIVTEMKIEIPKLDIYKLPFVKYDKDFDEFLIINPEVTIGNQLTGFEIYSNGRDLNINKIKLYNNLVTNINILNKGILYDFPPRIRIEDNNNLVELNCQLDGGGSGAIIIPVIRDGKIEEVIIENRGKDYTSAPKISIIDSSGSGAELLSTIKDKKINKIIIVSQGSNYSDNTLIDVGGEISTVYYNNADKIKIINSTITDEIIAEFQNVKFSSEFNIDTDKQDEIIFFENTPEVKVGNVITSLKIINEGNNLYTSIPNIYALYKDADDNFILDTKFNTRFSDGTIDYRIINGNIQGINNSKYIDIPYSDNKYTSIETTKIIVGGEITSINISNSNSNIIENKDFTSGDKLLIGESLDRLNLINPGNEIDDSFTSISNGYDLIFIDSNDNIILGHDIKYNLNINGDNNTIKKRLYKSSIINDGGGFGCLAEARISNGTGAEILTLMGIDKVEVCVQGKNYTNNDKIEILSGYHRLFNNIDRWNSLDNSLYITNNETITKGNIQQFLDNWIYVNNNEIPSINRLNIDFYSREIIKQIALYIDNNERENYIDSEFYRLVEKLETLNRSDNNDIYFYSFAIDNSLLQASGHINLSSFNKLQFRLNLKNPQKVNLKFKYDVNMYVNYYNIIEYNNGIGAIKYAN